MTDNGLLFEFELCHWVHLDFIDKAVKLLDDTSWFCDLKLALLDQIYSIWFVICFVDYIPSLHSEKFDRVEEFFKLILADFVENFKGLQERDSTLDVSLNSLFNYSLIRVSCDSRQNAVLCNLICQQVWFL